MGEISQESRYQVSARKIKKQKWTYSEKVHGFYSKCTWYAQSLLLLGPAAWDPGWSVLVKRPRSGQAVMTVKCI